MAWKRGGQNLTSKRLPQNATTVKFKFFLGRVDRQSIQPPLLNDPTATPLGSFVYVFIQLKPIKGSFRYLSQSWGGGGGGGWWGGCKFPFFSARHCL